MSKSAMSMAASTALAGGLVLSVMLGSPAQAAESALAPALTVPAVVEPGGELTISGQGCLSTPEQPAELLLTIGPYVVPVVPDAAGNWSFSVDVGKNGGFANDIVGQPIELFDQVPGTYAVQAVCDTYSGSSTLTGSFTVVDSTPPAITLSVGCAGDGCKYTLQSLPRSSYANSGIVAIIDNYDFTYFSELFLTKPDGTVWDLLDDEDLVQYFYSQSHMQKIFVWSDDSDSAAKVQLGVYTLTVRDGYESASASFTVVADPESPPKKRTKDSGSTLAETGVKLDVPLALSIGGLLLLAGAGAMSFARRRESAQN